MVLVEYMKDHELEEFPFYSAYFFHNGLTWSANSVVRLLFEWHIDGIPLFFYLYSI